MANSDPFHAWYTRSPWTGVHGLKVLGLQQDPLCRTCKRNPSTRVDHIIPHKGNWELFVDLGNLQGLCEECHNRKTREENKEPGPNDGNLLPTGTPGVAQFTSSAVGQAALDRALEED